MEKYFVGRKERQNGKEKGTKMNSPRNYRWQKAIAFDIAIEEKIIDSKFLPSIICLQFAMNLSLFC